MMKIQERHGMGKEKFEEYLDTQEKTEEVVIDWALKKEQWIKEVNAFLSQTKGYLGKYKDRVNMTEQDHMINEEYLGTYSTRKLIVKFNHDTVVFTPVGRNVIGAKGRIDMEGKAGTVKFVLVGEDSKTPQILTAIITNEEDQKEYDNQIKKLSEVSKLGKNVWKIATPPPKIQYLELNEDSFFDALMEVING